MTHSSQPISARVPQYLKDHMTLIGGEEKSYKDLVECIQSNSDLAMQVTDISIAMLERAGSEYCQDWWHLEQSQQKEIIEQFQDMIEALLVAGAIMVRPAGNQNQHKVDANVATHVLKTLPKFFDKVAEGTKTAELRKNDRGFKVGDYVKLIRSDGSDKPASITRRISHIVEGGQYGLAPDYCMLSLADIDEVRP